MAALAEVYRDQFPVADNLIYLESCGCGSVVPARGRGDEGTHGRRLPVWLSALQPLDGLLSAPESCNSKADWRFGGVRSPLVKNTSEGIATVALGLDWKAGDRIIAFHEEFPANYYPWLRLEAKGVEIAWFSIYDPLEKIAAALPGARLLAVSYVNYLSGYKVDLQALGELCRRYGCFYFVDAIQGMGAFPIDVEKCHIDALAADGHKWMLGPEGNGVLYVRKKWLDSIEPVEFGWTNPANYADYSSRDMTLRSDAGRYECGTLNTVGCFGQAAALEFLLEVGIENTEPAIDALAEQLENGVRARGYEVMRQRTRATGSGIVSFRHPSIPCPIIGNDLKHQGVTAALRQGWIRMSPHFYISPEEIEKVLGILPKV